MLTGVSSRRHGDGKQSILKIRCGIKGTSRRVVVVRSVERGLSVLIFRRSLLDLSLVVLTESSLSDSNLPLIYQSDVSVQAGRTAAPRSALMHSLQSWNESPAILISLRTPFFLGFSPSSTPVRVIGGLSPPTNSPHTGPAAYHRRKLQGWCWTSQRPGMVARGRTFHSRCFLPTCCRDRLLLIFKFKHMCLTYIINIKQSVFYCISPWFQLLKPKVTGQTVCPLSEKWLTPCQTRPLSLIGCFSWGWGFLQIKLKMIRWGQRGLSVVSYHFTPVQLSGYICQF